MAITGPKPAVASATPDEPASASPATRRWAFHLSRKTLIKILAFIGSVFAFILAFYGVGVLGVYDLKYTLSILNALWLGAENTLTLIAVVIPVGFAAGFVFGSGRTSRSWLVRSISTCYVEFFRSMPPVVLIAFSFLIVTVVVLSTPFLATRIPDSNSFAQAMAALALALHSGGYQAEIIRAGIQSVPTGQRDAAEAIGLSKARTMVDVVLPQMFRVSLPALGNEFASVIKDTSLLSVVGILELTFQASNLTSRLVTSGGKFENVILVYIEIAMIYFLMTFIVSRALQLVERRYRVPGLEAAQL